MQAYESIFIAPADIAPARLEEIIEKIKAIITKPGGEFKAAEKWGRRRLAYPIHRHREGFYVLLTFKAPSTVLAELTQFYKVSDAIVRHITCKAVIVRPVPPRAPRPGTPGAVGAPAAAGTATAAPAAAAPSAPAASTPATSTPGGPQ